MQAFSSPKNSAFPRRDVERPTVKCFVTAHRSLFLCVISFGVHVFQCNNDIVNWLVLLVKVAWNNHAFLFSRRQPKKTCVGLLSNCSTFFRGFAYLLRAALMNMTAHDLTLQVFERFDFFPFEVLSSFMFVVSF